MIGRFAQAQPHHAEAAVSAAKKAFPVWSATPVDCRAGVLIRAAAIMRRAPVRAGGLGGLRVRQALARGRRRRRRGDRLLRVLRPRDDPAGRARRSRRAGRDQRRRAHRAGRGRRDPPLELPAGDPDRHDRRRAGRGQHRGPQAERAIARDGRPAGRDPPRSRPNPRTSTRRVRQPPARLRRRGRGAGRRSARRPDRLHRLARRGPGDQPPGRRDRRRARTTSSG